LKKISSKSKELIPEAQKVSGHIREGQRKSREVVVNFHKTQEMTKELQETYSKLAKTFRQAIQVKLKPMSSCQDN
jgi:signal transduction histidine kinase